MWGEVMVIFGDCKCMRQAPKQAIEWAIDYHLSSLRKELREWGAIAQGGPLVMDVSLVEKNIAHLKKDLDYYMDLRKEIVELPRCDEPAFEVRSGETPKQAAFRSGNPSQSNINSR